MDLDRENNLNVFELRLIVIILREFLPKEENYLKLESCYRSLGNEFLLPGMNFHFSEVNYKYLL